MAGRTIRVVAAFFADTLFLHLEIVGQKKRKRAISINGKCNGRPEEDQRIAVTHDEGLPGSRLGKISKNQGQHHRRHGVVELLEKIPDDIRR